MFARHVSMVLKAHCAPPLTWTIKNQILLLGRKQKGFKDEITSLVPDRMEAIGIALWDHGENAAAYYRTTYPQVLEILARVVEGTTEVKTLEAINSAYHKIAARAATAS
jgi:hypothetical protein